MSTFQLQELRCFSGLGVHIPGLSACFASYAITVTLHPQTLKLAHGKDSLGEEKIPTHATFQQGQKDCYFISCQFLNYEYFGLIISKQDKPTRESNNP